MNGRDGLSNGRVWQRVQIGTSSADEANGRGHPDAHQSNSRVQEGFNDADMFSNEAVRPHLNKPRIGIGKIPFRQAARNKPPNYYGNYGPGKNFNKQNLSRYNTMGDRRYQGTFLQKDKWQPFDQDKKKKKKGKTQRGYPNAAKTSGTSQNKSGKGSRKKKGPKQMKKKFATRQTAFSILKGAIISDSAFAGKSIQQCFQLMRDRVRPSPRQGVKTLELPPEITYQQLYINLHTQVEVEFNQRQLYSCKKTSRANIDSSLGQVMAGMVKFEDEKKLPRGGWRKVLRNAVLHFTKAICKLEHPADGANVSAAKKALSEKAICDLYYSRAQAYCMLQRYGDFWSDALVALSLSPYVKQMELVSKLVEKRIEQVRRNADPRKKNRRTTDAAMKNWREETRAALKRAEDFLLLQAILDQQNDNKINRLMAYYTQINQLRKERLVEGEKKKPANPNPAAQQEKKQRAPATNIFDKVDVLDDNRLRVKVNIAKNRTVFYEQVIAFEAGSGKGTVNHYCANCYRRVNLCKAVPCSLCSDALFCNAVCREVAQGHSFCCQFTTQVRSKLSKNSYLAFQLICYCNFYILFTAEKNQQYKSSFKNPTSILDRNNTQIDFWPRYAAIAAVQKRIDSQEISIVTQNDQHLLADAMFLTAVLMNIQLIKLQQSQQIAFAEEGHIFSMMYKLLWIMHHDPLASSRLGKRKDFAITPFGNLLSFSCKPNIKRKFNQKKGRIEYQALVDLKPNDVLSVGWGTFLYAKEKLYQEKKKKEEAKIKSQAQGAAGQSNQARNASQVAVMTRAAFIKQLFVLNHQPCANCPNLNSTGN